MYSSLDKFNLFKYLFDDYKLIKAKLKLVIERIKEYLIYLCLQAEWQARSAYQINKLNKISYSKAIKNKFQYDNSILYKNDWLQKINHLNNLPYINTCINYWVNNHYTFCSTNSYFKYLYDLLIQIYQLKFNWYIFKLNKVSYYHNIDSCKCINYYNIIQMNKKCSRTCLYQIRNQIYKKDLFNRYRTNKNVSYKRIIEMIIQEVNKYYCHNTMSSNLISIFYVLNQINYLISYIILGRYRQAINKITCYSQLSLYCILYRKRISVYLYLNLFKVIR